MRVRTHAGTGHRLVRLLAATGVLASCTVAGPRPEGAGGPSPVRVPAGIEAGVEPGVRVGVAVAVDSAVLGGTGAFELVDAAGAVEARGGAGDVWVVRAAAGGLEVVRRPAATGGTGRAAPIARSRPGGLLVLRPAGDGRVTLGDRSYRGSLLLRAADTGVTVANALDLEAYLLGVVPLEIGAGRPAEEMAAVKAQAVAARTYAVRNLGRRGDLGFDFYGSVLDQAYGGESAEDPVASAAVRETRGEIVVYQGEPIEAYYHSTCGGRTAALDEVWPGTPRPYLRSVSDRRPDGGWYCESSSRFRWTEEWDAGELAAALTAALRATGRATGRVTRVDDIEITRRTPSGRVGELRIRTNLGETVVHGDSVRWILRPAPDRILNSASIELEPEGRGQVTHLTARGAGWGHGIGMCQIGALGRARAGESYREILGTYYPGTRIARLYR